MSKSTVTVFVEEGWEMGEFNGGVKNYFFHPTFYG